MTQSPSSATVEFEAKCDTAGWSIVELRIRWALGRTLEESGSRLNAVITGCGTLVEGTGLPVGPRSRIASAGPVHCANQRREVWNSKRNAP